MLDTEKERRRKRYKYALGKWAWADKPSVESKAVLKELAFYSDYEVICDWEPERVLRGMLKLLKENE